MNLKKIFLIAFFFLGMASNLSAADIDKMKFLIPGGAGGGWDGTARGVGEALTKSGIVGQASYENMSGGGGGKAIGYIIENAKSNHDTLMVQSTPIIIRSLTGRFPYNFKDLTMVAGVIGDYAAFVVRKDSPIKTFKDLVDAFKKNPRKVAVGGGSAPGSMDHLVAAQAIEAAGEDPTKLKYIAYDAGGKAMAALLSGEIKALSTGFSEAVELAKSGDIRVIAMTGDKRNEALPDVPTLKEQGYDMEFVNWRGFFGPPGLPKAKADKYRAALKKMYTTDAWENVRKRNGWVNIYKPGDEFKTFLENQEKTTRKLMKKLGFL